MGVKCIHSNGDEVGLNRSNGQGSIEKNIGMSHWGLNGTWKWNELRVGGIMCGLRKYPAQEQYNDYMLNIV